MKRFISVVLSAMLILLLLTACDGSAANEAEDTTAQTQELEETTTSATDETESETTEAVQHELKDMYGTYSRTNDDKYSSVFDFTISIYPDGTYYYYEGLGSHIAYGNYTVEGNVITLTDETIPHVDDKIFCFSFEYCGDKIVFLASESDQFMYVDDLPDGAIFNRAPEAEQ